MKKGFLLVIFAGIFWGSSGIFVRQMAELGFDTWQTTAVRLTISCLVMLIYCLIARRDAFKLTPKRLLLYIGSGLSLFGTSSFYFAAIQETSISVAVVLMYIAPVPVMLFSVAFLGERMTKSKLAATVMMLGGCSLVSGIFGGAEASLLGVVLGLLSGISYSVYNILTKIQMRNDCDPLGATLYTFMFAGLSGLAVCRPMQLPTLWSMAPLRVTVMAILLAVITCVLPYLLYTLSLRDIPVGTATALSIIEPMSASLVGMILFNEKLTLFTAVGMLLILVSVVLLSPREKKQNKIESKK